MSDLTCDEHLPGELSAYELRRLETIRANTAQLIALGLAPGQGLVPAQPQKAEERSHKAKPKPVDDDIQKEPERRSMRMSERDEAERALAAEAAAAAAERFKPPLAAKFGT